MRLSYTVTLAVALAGAAEQTLAQTVSGRLIDADSDAPVAAATVALLAEDDSVLTSVLTDADGQFRLFVEAGQPFRLRAQRIGYPASTTAPLTVSPGESLQIEFRISTDAVLLSPITVTAERRPWWESVRPQRVWGFYERMERHGPFGMGRYITAEELARQRGAPGWSILSSPLGFGIRTEVPRQGSTLPSLTIRGPLRVQCSPVYFIDGLRFRGDELSVYSTVESLVSRDRLEGIELYSPWYVPSEIAAQLFHNEGCVILIWTRAPPGGG
jgi:hypothetical protein